MLQYIYDYINLIVYLVLLKITYFDVLKYIYIYNFFNMLIVLLIFSYRFRKITKKLRMHSHDTEINVGDTTHNENYVIVTFLFRN